jgi:hypothetical protein
MGPRDVSLSYGWMLIVKVDVVLMSTALSLNLRLWKVAEPTAGP